MNKYKVLLVGDGGIGKSCLLIRVDRDYFPQDYVPVTYDPFVRTFEPRDSEAIDLHCFEKQRPRCDAVDDRLDPLEYSDADLIMMCFAFDSPESLDSLTEKWIKDVKYYTGDRYRLRRNTGGSNFWSWLGISGSSKKRSPLPLIMVGCKSDLRGSEEVEKRLRRFGLSMVNQERIDATAKLLEVKSCLECSALTGEGAIEVFQCAAEILAKLQKEKSTNLFTDILKRFQRTEL
ncbi:P-loop containing nucleoside triphosphate hydrolase protein [Serendipita vermifera]|nr:P-loop containing nucleoside triphosphate hydrolase protein [Serendipita vermifera]